MVRKKRGRRQRLIVGALLLALLAQLVPAPGRANAANATVESVMAAAAAAVGTSAANAGPSASASPTSTDIAGHWAEATIGQWLRDGLVSGFPDGRFRPGSEVNRAELAAMINKSFGYDQTGTHAFPDVAAGKWYASDVSRAQEAGYMQGDAQGLFRPEAAVTRGEAAVVLARLLKLDTTGQTGTDAFADAKSIAAWARGPVSAVAQAGFMKGYADNRFRAGQALTRAEAVVLLDRARQSFYAHTDIAIPAASIDKPGTYGPVSGAASHKGDLAIDVPGVVLRNVTIEGDLVLGEGIGEGDVTLDHVVVEGATTIKGGGKNSVHLLDSKLTRVFITKVDGQVRVVIEGSTSVDQVTVNSGATLQVASGSGGSYGTVTVATTGEVTLDGDFPNVVLVTAAQVTVTTGKIGTMTLTEQAAGASVTLMTQSQVGTINAGAAAAIKGDGAIGTLSVTADGVTAAQKPAKTVVDSGLSASVGGTVVAGTGSSGGHGAGTGSNGGGDGSGTGSNGGGDGSNTGSNGGGGGAGTGSNGGGDGSGTGSNGGGDGSNTGSNGGGDGSGTDPDPGSDPGDTPSVTKVVATVTDPTASGFDLSLSPAVPDMTIADLVMVTDTGLPALVSKLSTTDGGATYRADGFLTGGIKYTLSFAKPNYSFGASQRIYVTDVPAITGAMISPDLMKLVLLFHKPLAALPEAPAGFELTDAGTPVAITGMTLSDSATRIEFTFGAAVHPDTLELRYTPGTVRATDDIALPALAYRTFTDGSAPSGRAAYDRMLGMTGNEAAADLKDNASLSPRDAAQGMLEGGYNTNAIIKALNTVYGITNETLPDLLLPLGVSVYHLLIGMKEAGILDLSNLGKNFSHYVGDADEWVRALKQAGYPDDQVASVSWFFPNVELATALRKYYDTTNERAAKILWIYDSIIRNVGFVLRDVYGNDDRQAVEVLKAAGVSGNRIPFDADNVGQVLQAVYEDDANQAAALLKEFGYAGTDIAKMLQDVYGMEPQDIVRALRGAGFTISEVWYSLGYVNNPAEAMRGAYSAKEFYDFQIVGTGGRVNLTTYFLKAGGYSATETANALRTNGDIHTAADVLNQLLLRDPPDVSDPEGYSVSEAAKGIRQSFGLSLADLAALLVQFGVPTATTKQPGQTTIAHALGEAGFGLSDIVAYLAPSNTLTEDQASGVLFELRDMGLPLNNSLTTFVTTLARKTYRDTSNASLIKLLVRSGRNTATNQTIPGFSATDIARFLVSAGLANNYSLGVDLQTQFSKLDTVNAIVDISGVNAIDLLRIMSEPVTRLFQDSRDDMLLVGHVLKDIYAQTADQAVRTLRSSAVPDLYGIYCVKTILGDVYGHSDTSALIADLAGGGYTTRQIADGLGVSYPAFRDAGYTATDVARFMYTKGVQLDQLAFGLKNLGYGLDDVALALRNLLGSPSAFNISQVTDWLNNPINGYNASDVATAVATAFDVDPFVALAQTMYDHHSATATQAAVMLRDSLGVTDPVAMATGLAGVGYSRGDVLVAIFQTYCDGNIYSENALAKMDAVLTTVYPEVTNHLEATLEASNVNTPKFALTVLRSLGKSTAEVIDVLDHVYGVRPAAMLEILLMNRGDGLTDEQAIQAVSDHFGADGAKIYVSMMVAQNYSASQALYQLQYQYHYNGVQIAQLLIEAGYEQSSVLYAIYNDYHGDSGTELAKVLVQVFGTSDVSSVAKELFKRNYSASQSYVAIKTALPGTNQGAILLSMMQIGFNPILLYAMMQQSDFGNGDATAVDQLRTLGLRASEAANLLRRWGYSLRDTIRPLIEQGYSLTDIGRSLSWATSEDIIRQMRAMNYSIEQYAVVAYGSDMRISMLLTSLYMAGVTNIDDLVQALAAIHENPIYYAADLMDAKLSLNATAAGGPARNWTATTIAVALSKNSPLSLTQLGYSLLNAKASNFQRYFTDMNVYDALKSVANIGVSFINADLDSAISAMLTDLSDGIPFIIMEEASMSASDAASIMKRLGWDWIPACIQLVQAGYGASSTWDALWDVYHNELGFQILNIMSAVAPLASLGLAENLSTFETVARAAMRKAMMSYFTS